MADDMSNDNCGANPNCITNCNQSNICSPILTIPSIPSLPSISSMPSTSAPKPDPETLFQNYLKAFKDRMIEFNVKESIIEESVKSIDDIFQRVKKNNQKFLNSTQFSKLLEVFTSDVLGMKSEELVNRYHKDLVTELYRFAQTSDKKSSPTKVKNRAQKVKDLTTTLKKLQKQIMAAENQELDLNDLDKPSSFTDLPKLYKRAQEVWTKREELLKRSTFTGRVLFKKYKCNSTDYPDINKCVEDIFNTHLKKMKNKTTKGYIDESFTFIDVRKAILDVINEKQLVVPNSEGLIKIIYENLMKEKRQRRQIDSEESFETLETLTDLKPETFVDSDPLLELELTKNKKAFQTKINELFEKYAHEDRKKNGESVLTEGISEWDADFINNNEEFESLDVKDGDLEEDNIDDEESEDDVCSKEPLPDFSTNVENIEPLKSVPSNAEPEVLTISDSDDGSDDEIVILS